MSDSFLKEYHAVIHQAGTPPGNLSSVNWTSFANTGSVLTVDCMPLSHILHRAKAKHVNYFILDVEGGELEVLKSINWAYTKFDVLCVETSGLLEHETNNRPPGFADNVVAYLAERGYHNVTGQEGRNIWFTRSDFVPSARPGLDPKCFSGARKAIHADKWYTNRRTPPYQRCAYTK